MSIDRLSTSRSRKVRPAKIALATEPRVRAERADAGTSRRAFAARIAGVGLGASFGSIAQLALEQQESARANGASFGCAKRCLLLFLEGGPSHIDTFDPKPALDRLHGQTFQKQDKFASAMSSGLRRFVKSPFTFRQCGQSGLWMNDELTHLANVADRLCVYRGLQVDSTDHPTACYQINTGNRLPGDPAMGAWVSYGLGADYENLPAFMVLPEAAYPQGGAANWANGFLPSEHGALALRSHGSPLVDLQPHFERPAEATDANRELLQKLNERHARRHPTHQAIRDRRHDYELAFRMQAEAPDLLDISQESSAMQRKYGLDQPQTEAFGRRCLLARRLLEKGVRFVQVYSGGWDSHDFLERSHRARIASVDRPAAALIDDLAERGLLDETLVVICGEFGRSPDNGLREGNLAWGRDHNARAMSVVLAGGGVRGGRTVGATDEIGGEAVEAVHPIRDFHVTLLRLLGLDDNRLTFLHAGRFKQLSQTGGALIEELLA